MITLPPAEEARITLDSVWLGVGLNLLRTGPAEDTSRYLNHLHQMKEGKHGPAIHG
ncbi:hypothetical protein [Nesterenkonia jeotgali]|uniref:hypothetical protein n=1 Tax=Nesterenkonia jeotgali TaxID=317018 RepID=UPI000A6B462E|nr:hypothetical protein [Nesterenkonia jeotgali]